MFTLRQLVSGLLGLVLLSSVGADAALGLGRIHGKGRFERIKGQPAMGYIELYEDNLYLSPESSSPTGPHRRLGTTWWSGSTCVSSTVGGGRYCIDIPAGTYSILLNQPLFYVNPTVVPDIFIPNTTMELNVELPIDYSAYYRDSGQWTGAGATWYQTYTAVGTGVRGVSFVLAGGPPRTTEVSILEDNGDPDVRNWTLLGMRNDSSTGADTDNWVRWRSGEIPTTPGTQYAVRITGIGGSIQPYKRNKSLGNAYVGGRAYDENGNAQAFDLNYVVFTDADGAIVTLNKRTEGLGDLKDGYFATRWGQTFVAQGGSLAGVDVWAAGAGLPNEDCPERWDLDFEWRVRQGGPTGTQVGPTKIIKAGYQAAGAGLHGVSYSPDEVPLTAGQTYFIEFAYASGPGCAAVGFNPYMSNDPYAGVHGYQWNGSSWTPRILDDVSMTILEYEIAGPIIELSPTSISRDVFHGDSLGNGFFTVTNVGTDLLTYSITDNAGWLSVSPPTGASGGETDTITVMYDVAGLECDTHEAVIEIDGNGINSPQELPVTVVVHSVPGDMDCDCDVDSEDWGLMQACLTGPGIAQTDPACADALLDVDDDVDQDDVEIFLACHSGPDVCAERDCATP